MRLSGFQIVTQDNGGTNLVNQLFVLSRLAPKSCIEHGLMGQNRSEPLVVVFNGDLRLMLAPALDELLHTSHVLTWLPVGLSRFANHNPLYRFTTDVGQQKVV